MPIRRFMKLRCRHAGPDGRAECGGYDKLNGISEVGIANKQGDKSAEDGNGGDSVGSVAFKKVHIKVLWVDWLRYCNYKSFRLSGF